MEGRVRFYRGIGWGLFGGGMVLLGLTAATNWFQGDHLGVTVAGKWINSLGSVTIDLVGLVFIGMAAGSCWAIRRYTWATLFTLALILSAGWSANSILSFQATERISASKSRDAVNKRSEVADKLQVDDYRWKRGTAVTSRYKTTREQFLDSAADSLKAFREAKVQAHIEPDAGAQVIANVTGYNLETVQIGQSGYFALLLIFLKALCFPGAGYFLNPLAFAIAEPKKTHHGSDGSHGSGGGEPKKKPDLKSVPKPEPSSVRAEPSRQRRSWSYVPATGAPERNLSAFDRAWEVANQHPYLSTRAIAARAGVSQSTGHRVKQRALTKVDRIVRRYGNGRGFHSPAYN